MLYSIFKAHPHVQTDTRKLKEGDLFFALKGPNFNGNQFALQALEAGAAYAVVDEDVDPSNERLIRVDDVLQALQDLAAQHRNSFKIPFIAITGSNGKTTTKELVYTVLASHFTSYTTQGNLNNHIGVPLTLLSIPDNAQMAIIEMGANHLGEIASYCQYTRPTYGIITNCGKAHLEGFGSLEGVRKGKGELYDHIREHNGGIFIYHDHAYLQAMSEGITKRITYGTKVGDITGEVIASEPFLEVMITKGFNSGAVKVGSRLVGAYNLSNVLCAVAVGLHFGVPEEKIIQSIEGYTPSNSRSQLVEQDGNHIILDAYNANPTSMRAAIENFAALPASRKVLMLGAMMELGAESVLEHQAIVSLIEQYKWDAVVLVGGDFSKVQHAFQYFPDAAAARAWYTQQAFKGTHLLIKGSRGMRMEQILHP